jgi:hypothetical protein
VGHVDGGIAEFDEKSGLLPSFVIDHVDQKCGTFFIKILDVDSVSGEKPTGEGKSEIFVVAFDVQPMVHETISIGGHIVDLYQPLVYVFITPFYRGD